jgi:CheY-like chemotaxis protein
MTGPEALALCESWSPHLVIYDSLLDGMRAWQFGFRLLRSDPPQHQRPYLVALTHLTSNLQRSLCEEVGFDEYKAKPITQEELDGWIEKARKKEIYFA